MPKEQTVLFIKPDAVKDNHIGEIISRLESSGLQIIAAKMVHLAQEEAQEFYAVHQGKPFYDSLVEYVSSGPIMVLVLEGENAIAKNREIMGTTDPKNAAPGTIRADFAKNIEANAVHGSDGPETAKTEISFFFGNGGICKRG